MIRKLIDKWKREDEDTYHFRVSSFKSAARIAAGVSMLSVGGAVAFAGAALIVAEILGVVEEL